MEHVLDGSDRAVFSPLMLVNRRDVRAYLLDKFETIAPDDLFALAERRREVLDKAKQYAAGHPHLRDRVHLATSLIDDFTEGECTNIPLYALALVAVAILYVLQDVDAIPDFLPGGMDDDDLMLEVAFEMARPGLERYCDSKGLDCGVLDAKAARPKAKKRAT